MEWSGKISRGFAASAGPYQTGATKPPGCVNRRSSLILEKVFQNKDEAAQMKEKMPAMVPMKRWGMTERRRNPVCPVL
jgi:hypothetical protein